jgi:hypothetical protein
MIFRNTPLARQIVKWWGSPTRCEEEAERWRERGMTVPMVDMMRYWCPRDNDQDAFNRLLVTMKHKHFGTTGGIRVVGARYLNRPMFPTNPECLEDGTICHMYGQSAAYRTMVLDTVLNCTYRYLGLIDP